MAKMGAGTRDSPITIDDDSENEVLQELFNQSLKTTQPNHSHKSGKSATINQATGRSYDLLSRHNTPIPPNHGYNYLSRHNTPIPPQETSGKRKRTNSTVSVSNIPIQNFSHGPPPPYSSIEGALIRESKKARKRRRQLEREGQVIQQLAQTLPLAITQPKRDPGKKPTRESTHSQLIHNPSSQSHTQAIIKQQSLPVSLATFPANCWPSFGYPFNHLLPLQSQPQLCTTGTSSQFMNRTSTVDNSFHYSLSNIGLPFATTPQASSWVSSMAMAAENSANKEAMGGPWVAYTKTSAASSDPSIVTTSSHSTGPGPSKPKITTHIPTGPRALCKKDFSKSHPPESRLQLPEPPTGPAQKRPPVQKSIGMMPDLNPNSKHGTFPKQDRYTPNPARTLVMEQLPKNFRNREYVIKWAKSTSPGRPQPLNVIVDKMSGKALIEFPSAELARAAWSSPKLTERKANIQLWWYRLEGVGADAGVGEIEEGEIEEDAVEKVPDALPKNETKKERKSRLATERARAIAIFKAAQQERAQKEGTAQLHQALQTSATQPHPAPLAPNYLVSSRPSNLFPSARKYEGRQVTGHMSPYSASLPYQESSRHDCDRESISSSRRSTSPAGQDLDFTSTLAMPIAARDDEDMEVDDDDMIPDLPYPNNACAGVVETGFSLAAVPDPLPPNQPTKQPLMDNAPLSNNHHYDLTRHPSASLNLPSIHSPSPTSHSASEGHASPTASQGASGNASSGTSKLARLKDLEERIARGKRELEDRFRVDDEKPWPLPSSVLRPVLKSPPTLPSGNLNTRPHPKQTIAVGDDEDKQFLEDQLRQRVLTSQKSRVKIGSALSAPSTALPAFSGLTTLPQSGQPPSNAHTPQVLDSLNLPPSKPQAAIINEELIDRTPTLESSALLESKTSNSNWPAATSLNALFPQVQPAVISPVSPMAPSSTNLTHPSKPPPFGYSPQAEPLRTPPLPNPTSNPPIPTSLDDLAVSIIKQAIEDTKVNPQDAKPIATHAPRPELQPDPDDLATTRKRLESHIEEIKTLMLEHERASTKEEKCRIMAVMREKTRLNEEKRADLSNSLKASQLPRAMCWPKPRDDAGVILLSDDESDEDMDK